MAKIDPQIWYCGNLETGEIIEVVVIKSTTDNVWIPDQWGHRDERMRRVPKLGTMRVYAKTREEVEDRVLERFEQHILRLERALRRSEAWLDHYRGLQTGLMIRYGR